MSHPPNESSEHEIEQQIRLVRGLMAALYARNATDPDESLPRELTEAKKTLRELQLRRDAERAEAEKARAGLRKTMSVPLGPETTGLTGRHHDPAPADPRRRLSPARPGSRFFIDSRGRERDESHQEPRVCGHIEVTRRSTDRRMSRRGGSSIAPFAGCKFSSTVTTRL
jgi:hypothetical protein